MKNRCGEGLQVDEKEGCDRAGPFIAVVYVGMEEVA